MAYRIEYEYTTPKQNPSDKPTYRLVGMTAVVLIVFLLLVHTFWPQGQQVLRELVIPGDAETTLQAMDTFADELRCGNSFSGAAEVFCREILTHADIH